MVSVGIDEGSLVLFQREVSLGGSEVVDVESESLENSGSSRFKYKPRFLQYCANCGMKGHNYFMCKAERYKSPYFPNKPFVLNELPPVYVPSPQTNTKTHPSSTPSTSTPKETCEGEEEVLPRIELPESTPSVEVEREGEGSPAVSSTSDSVPLPVRVRVQDVDLRGGPETQYIPVAIPIPVPEAEYKKYVETGFRSFLPPPGTVSYGHIHNPSLLAQLHFQVSALGVPVPALPSPTLPIITQSQAQHTDSETNIGLRKI